MGQIEKPFASCIPVVNVSKYDYESEEEEEEEETYVSNKSSTASAKVKANKGGIFRKGNRKNNNRMKVGPKGSSDDDDDYNDENNGKKEKVTFDVPPYHDHYDHGNNFNNNNNRAYYAATDIEDGNDSFDTLRDPKGLCCDPNRSFWKPATWILTLLLLICIGGIAFLSVQWFRQRAYIDDLEAQINQLKGEDQMNQLRNSNNILNATVQNLMGENQDLANQILNSSMNDNNNDKFHDEEEECNNLRNQRNALNKQVETLQQQVDELSKQNNIYENLNTELNTTANNLSNEVNRLELAVDTLKDEKNHLSTLIGTLRDEINTLNGLNNDLGLSVSNLENEVFKLTNETQTLKVLNDDLNNIVSFLNETTITKLDDTYEGITKFLSEQITAYRAVIIETLQNTYTQRISNWDCGYRDRFRIYDFIHNDNQPISSDSNGGNGGLSLYIEVMDYIDERILSELCLNRNDFEFYLDNQFVKSNKQPPITATTNDIIRAVQLYTMSAMDYYFDGNDLSGTDWAEANYDCNNLTPQNRFIMK